LLKALLELGLGLWPFLLSIRLNWQDWKCLEELRLRCAVGTVLVLAVGEPCLKAREKLERREKYETQGFDIVGPIAGQLIGGRR